MSKEKNRGYAEIEMPSFYCIDLILHLSEMTGNVPIPYMGIVAKVNLYFYWWFFFSMNQIFSHSKQTGV